MTTKEGATRNLVSLNTTAEISGLVGQLERAALNLQANGDAVGHALVSEVAVAAGMLRYKCAAADGKVSGEVGSLIQRLHKLL